MHRNQSIMNLITLCSLVIGFLVLIVLNDHIYNRLSLTIYEVTTWFKEPTIYSSAGSRLSMWVASAQLISENWIGYGELAVKDIAANHFLSSSKMLSLQILVAVKLHKWVAFIFPGYLFQDYLTKPYRLSIYVHSTA